MALVAAAAALHARGTTVTLAAEFCFEAAAVHVMHVDGLGRTTGGPASLNAVAAAVCTALTTPVGLLQVRPVHRAVCRQAACSATAYWRTTISLSITVWEMLTGTFRVEHAGRHP